MTLEEEALYYAEAEYEHEDEDVTYLGKKCFLMMPISSITKKGNVQTCLYNLTLFGIFTDILLSLTIEMCSKDGAK